MPAETTMAMVDRLTPPLTTVRLPLHQIGELSARLLLAEIEGPPHESAVQSLLGVKLAVRGTTARPPRAEAAHGDYAS